MDPTKMQPVPPEVLERFKKVLMLHARVHFWVHLALFIAIPIGIVVSPNKLTAAGIAAIVYVLFRIVSKRLGNRIIRVYRHKYPGLANILDADDAVYDELEGKKYDDLEANKPKAEDPKLTRWLEGLPDTYPAFDMDQADLDAHPDAPGDPDDTLYEDTTGHGVELEEAIYHAGLEPCVEYIHGSDDNWTMVPWGSEVLLSIEAVAACSGAPSQNQWLGRVKRWGSQVDYQPPADLVDTMLAKIDFILTRYREDPEACGLNPDISEQELDAVCAVGQKMRDRIASLR